MRAVLGLLVACSFGCGGELAVHDGGALADAALDGSIDAGSDAASTDAGPSDGGVAPSPVNVGWIGGACVDASDCFDVSGAVCSRDGFPNGLCTSNCDGICPDRGPGDSTTFCVDGTPFGLAHGACVSRCDTALLPGSGCPAGYRCQEQNRYGDPSTTNGVCVPERAAACSGAGDELVPLDYPDRGAVWIPAEASCDRSIDLLVMLHGLNPSSNPTPSLGGGRRLELLVRAQIDAGLVRSLALAEPVHFQASSIELYGSAFDPAEHLRRVQAILAPRGITLRSLSYVAHSGAGCDRNNGLYEVLDRFADLVGPFAPAMRLWGLMDTCYASAYHWQVPLAVLGGRGVAIASMYTTGDTLGAIDAFETGLLVTPETFACDAALYGRCVRAASERWCSYRTAASSPVVHGSNPYFFLREVLPRAFSTDPTVEPCR